MGGANISQECVLIENLWLVQSEACVWEGGGADKCSQECTETGLEVYGAELPRM